MPNPPSSASSARKSFSRRARSSRWACCCTSLSTNAVKYGALSVPDGHVYLTWERSENGSIWLSWRESGGPQVKAPTEPGFGTTLIQQIIESQLGGTFRAHWDSEGYGMMMSLPETALQSDRPGPRGALDRQRGDGRRATKPSKAGGR